MPSVRITTGEWARTSANALATAAREAVASVLNLPLDEQDVSFHSSDVSPMRPSSSQPVRFVRLEIFMLQGRDQITKGRLHQQIAVALSRLGVSELKVLFIELARENVLVSAATSTKEAGV